MTKTNGKGVNRVLWLDEGAKGKSGTRKSRIRKSQLLFLTLVMFFLITSSLFFVWSRIQVIQLGYELSSALKEGRSLAETNKRLRLEIATLKSYARIEKVAVEQLGMSKPKPEQVIVIR